MPSQTTVPASSDAEIRAYLRPMLKAGKPPTYKVMRATLGGGFSRLARIKKQVERELAGDGATAGPADDHVGAADLVATLEALFDRQWKAIEALESRSLDRVVAAPPARRSPVASSQGPTEVTSAQADRLEAVERRLLTTVDRLQALAKVHAAPLAHTLAVNAAGRDVPPSWARQAAAAATAALDGRLQSVEEMMRDTAASGRAAFDLAAEIAREVAADASLQLQVARSTLGKAVRDEFASSDRSALLDGIHQALRTLNGQIGDGFATAAAVANRRAAGIRDAIIAMVDIEMAQVEMFEVEYLSRLDSPSAKRHRKSQRKEHEQNRTPR